MTKTHYQDFVVDKKDHARALCRYNLIDPVTTTDGNEVTCKRCITAIGYWRRHGVAIRYGLSPVELVRHGIASIKERVIDWLYRVGTRWL